MVIKDNYGVYGYRFQENPILPLYQLFAVGFQDIRQQEYDWDGMKRIDGPLYLFQYTISGRGKIELDGQLHDVPEGTSFLVEIPGRHRYYLPEDSSHWTFYFALFRQNNLHDVWKGIRNELGPLPQFEPRSLAIRRLETIYSEARIGAIKDGYYASALVYSFIMELLRSSSALRQERSNWPEIVRRAADYIAINFRILEGLDQIAEAAGCSKYHLARTFHQATNFSPMAYTSKLRIELAVKLLRNSSLTVEEIAREVGYQNGSYFSKVFRNWTGYSPSRFREGKELLSIDQIMFD
ncbi:hypothetical protein ASG89_10605 [Paenibacillus sp. Soil766]|uniref:helix-turn-helix transcriptional regulator n=1 Tax=Paenibacillus sp. Soil766 TaxID=1736404 RepID=UPI00070FBFB0|nr:AraC family transcriptional regulator [Paenibacillus sp. Soil766]KRE86454.1 hypothetical protein ASG89_10605 [Paenibacillus sp. Soil766]